MVNEELFFPENNECDERACMLLAPHTYMWVIQLWSAIIHTYYCTLCGDYSYTEQCKLYCWGEVTTSRSQCLLCVPVTRVQPLEALLVVVRCTICVLPCILYAPYAFLESAKDNIPSYEPAFVAHPRVRSRPQARWSPLSTKSSTTPIRIHFRLTVDTARVIVEGPCAHVTWHVRYSFMMLSTIASERRRPWGRIRVLSTHFGSENVTISILTVSN